MSKATRNQKPSLRSGAILKDPEPDAATGQTEPAESLPAAPAPHPIPAPGPADPLPPIPFTLLYVDQHIIAVNKPEGIASIPEGAGDHASLRSQLEEALAAKLFVVHRLDKDVSGIMVFARDADVHRFLNKQFHDREVHKRYQALVMGVVRGKQGSVSAPLREFGSGRMGVDQEAGKKSLTRYRVEERFPQHTLLGVTPVSGRRHQIRVHLYHIGHPIAGDPRYGDRAAAAAYPRLMLHARVIDIPMPDGRRLRIEAPLPRSFESVVDGLRPAAPHP